MRDLAGAVLVAEGVVQRATGDSRAHELEQHVCEAPGNQAELELLRDLAAQIEHALRQPLEAALHLVRVRVRIRVRG